MKVSWIGLAIIVAICCHVVGDETAPGHQPWKIDSQHLPNAYRIHAKVISGGQPAGEAAFQELQSLGVKTIISVDGAKPEALLARKYGLRYVHLPHGYDGIPADRVTELAKAVRDLPGPIYIHCHHGKHRSPAAAAVACVSVGYLTPTDAREVLEVAGTGENYRGLYQSAEAARRIEDSRLDAIRVVFREIIPLPLMAEAMVQIEHRHDQLKSLARSRWKPGFGQKDRNPAHEALMLREQFSELSRTEEARRQPKRFREWLDESEVAAKDLEAALLDSPAGGSLDVARADRAFDRITENCAACHHAYRDRPLSEKNRR